jgi:hypothetical protein
VIIMADAAEPVGALDIGSFAADRLKQQSKT